MTRATTLWLASVALALTAAFGWQSTTVATTSATPTPQTATAAVAGTSSDATIDGSAVFRAKGCGGCHAAPGWKPEHSMGYPDLRDAASWAKDRRPGVSARDYLIQSIRFPDAFLSPAYTGGGHSPMPTLQLSARELDAVVDYLLTG